MSRNDLELKDLQVKPELSMTTMMLGQSILE
jgi:hypothetical protein